MVKHPPANVGDARDVDSVPGSGRSPGGGHDNPLQCSCLKNPRQESQAGYLNGFEKNRTRLSGFHNLLYLDPC